MRLSRPITSGKHLEASACHGWDGAAKLWNSAKRMTANPTTTSDPP